MDDKTHKQKRRLKAWLLLHGVEQKELAARLRISPQLLSMALSGRRMTKERFAALTAEGIPAALLPEPTRTAAREGFGTADSLLPSDAPTEQNRPSAQENTATQKKTSARDSPLPEEKTRKYAADDDSI